MTSSAFFAAMRRQWLLVLIGLLASVGLAGTAYLVSKPTYEITATILLLPPTASVPSDSNPYLQLGGLRQAVDLVGVALSDQDTATSLRAISKDVEFTAQADPRSSAPILVIDVKDSSPEGAVAIRNLLVSRVPVRLAAMQKELSVGLANRVTSTVVTSDSKAQEVGRQRIRLAIAALGAGLGATLVLTAWRDSRRLRRAARRAAQRPDAGELAGTPVNSNPGTETLSDSSTGQAPATRDGVSPTWSGADHASAGTTTDEVTRVGHPRELRTVADAGRGALG